MGDKAEAKAVMAAAGVPVVPGYHGADQRAERLVGEAKGVGYPLLVKAVSGGGGKGMKLARAEVGARAGACDLVLLAFGCCLTSCQTQHLNDKYKQLAASGRAGSRA
jgi:hypothetical protein